MKCLLISLLSLAILCGMSPAAAEAVSCPDQKFVEVLVADTPTVEKICAAAGQAIDFLGRFGIYPKRSIKFEIIEEQIDHRGYSAYGSYDSKSDRIRLMSYASIHAQLKNPKMYGEPLDMVHYAGAIAHEVAHAVVQHNLHTELLSPAPQEYLAHATQLAVLPEERRERILKAMGVASWESGDAISDIYMGIEPGKFAAKSYLHLTRMLDPGPFVAILLNAKWFYVYVP